jgi:hypothetical protein
VATFRDAGALAEDPAFIRQVKVALMVAGGTVAIEDRSQYPDSAMFAQRRSLAINVLQDPDTWAHRFASIVQYDERVRAAAPTEANPTPAPVDDFLLAAIIYWTWNAVSGAGPAITPPPPSPPVSGDVPLAGGGGLVMSTPAQTPVLVPHPVSGVGRVLGAPNGQPLDLRTEGDVEQVQLRHPVRPPGAPAGWPGMSPWHEALQRSEEE